MFGVYLGFSVSATSHAGVLKNCLEYCLDILSRGIVIFRQIEFQEIPRKKILPPQVNYCAITSPLQATIIPLLGGSESLQETRLRMQRSSFHLGLRVMQSRLRGQR
jgi:hypothetical protein